MMRRRTLLSGTAGFLTPGLLAAPALAQSDNRPVLTIAVQRLSNSNTFEPPREQSNVGFRIHGLYAEQLIGTDWLNNAALVPGLAASWKRVDARTLDLSLRPNVKFHDGSLLTAEDVVFSFNERLFGTQGATGAGQSTVLAGTGLTLRVLLTPRSLVLATPLVSSMCLMELTLRSLWTLWQ